MIVQTPYGPTNTVGGEILTDAAARKLLKPLAKRPRKKPTKRHTYKRRPQTQLWEHIAVVSLLAVLVAAISITQ